MITPGDNREVNIVTGISIDVVFWIHDQENPTNTTADDTANKKYFDNTLSPANKFVLNPTQTCSIKKINGTTLTDPITVTSNGYTETGARENYGYGGVSSITITFTQNTLMRIRVV